MQFILLTFALIYAVVLKTYDQLINIFDGIQYNLFILLVLLFAKQKHCIYIDYLSLLIPIVLWVTTLHVTKIVYIFKVFTICLLIRPFLH